MSTYFPYSHIIANIKSRVNNAISSTPYMGDWMPTGLVSFDNASGNNSTQSPITELYY